MHCACSNLQNIIAGCGDFGKSSVEGGNGKAEGFTGFAFVAIEFFQHLQNMFVFQAFKLL